MYITVTMHIKGKTYNIQADENLPIQNAASTLYESFNFDNEPPVYFKSVLQHKIVSSYFTFYQAEIQNGDILRAIE